MRGNKFFTAIDRYAGIALILLLKAAGVLLYPFSILRKAGSGILVIKFSAMGDTILLLPVLKKLKAAAAGAKITMIATKVNAEVLENTGLVDELIIFDLAWLKNPARLAGFIAKLRSAKFSTAIDFDQWLRISPIIAFLSGAKKTYGFKTTGQFRHFLYTKATPHGGAGHEIDRFFALLKDAGIESTGADKKLFFDVPVENIKDAGQLVGNVKTPYTVIHPGCGSHGYRRQWPEENYAEFIKLIRAKYGVVLSAGPGEEAVCEKINSMSGGGSIIIKGTKLGVLAAVIKNAAFFVSGNTGVMHLAAALDVPLIAFHGPTDPARWGPLGEKSIVVKSPLNCSPCLYLGSEYGCNERKCMETITVEMAVESLKRIENKG